jgi:hypothetical protein
VGELLHERLGIGLFVIVTSNGTQQSDFLFGQLRQIVIEFALFEPGEDDGPELRCIRKWPCMVMAPEFAADERQEVWVAEGLAEQPSS